MLAAAIVDRGVCIVVACCRIRTTGAGSVVAGAIIGIGAGDVVARERIGTAIDLVLVADAVSVGIIEAGSAAIDVVDTVQVHRVDAGSVVHRGASLEVAGALFGAAHHLVFVADAVAVLVIEAVSVAVVVIDAEEVDGVGTGTVLDIGLRVVVAGFFLEAALNLGTGEEREVLRIVKGTDFLALFLDVEVETELVQGALVGVEKLEFEFVSRSGVGVQGHPACTVVFEGHADTDSESVDRSQYGVTENGLILEGHVGRDLNGNEGQDRGREVRLVARVEFVADAVTILVTEADAVTVVTGIGIGAGTVVIRGVSIEIASGLIRTAADFIPVADEVAIGIVQAVSVAVEAVLGIGAAAILDGGITVVVAGLCIGTACAGQVFARTVIVGGGGIVVASAAVRAASELILIANAVFVRVVETVAVTVQVGGSVEIDGIQAVGVVGVRVIACVASIGVGASF